MDIKILEFIHDSYNHRKGWVDFEVTKSEGNVEIFRNVGYFEKDGKNWVSIGSCKRNDEWKPKLDRPGLKDILIEVRKVLKDYMQSHNTEPKGVDNDFLA